MSMTMSVQVEKITPKQAQKALDNNIEKNRQVSRRWVNQIVDMMQRGEWKENGEAIKFQQHDDNGVEKLVDGQHRLRAIIKYGKPVNMLVVRGLEPTCFYTIDAGRKRTAGDVLSIAGYQNCNLLAASARLVYNFKKDHTFGLTFTAVPSLDIVKIVEDHPDLIQSTLLGHKGRFIVPGSYLVFLHFLTSIDNPDEADDFLTKITEGVSMVKGDPVLTFRDRMFRYKAQNIRLRRQFQLGLLIKTWNYYLAGQRVEKLRFAADETFPIIAGFDRKKLWGEDYTTAECEDEKADRKRVIRRQPMLFEKGTEPTEAPEDAKLEQA